MNINKNKVCCELCSKYEEIFHITIYEDTEGVNRILCRDCDREIKKRLILEKDLFKTKEVKI